MAKFKSIWGDLEVNTIIDKDPTDERKVTTEDPEKGSEPTSPEEEEENKGSNPKPTTDPKDPEGGKEEEDKEEEEGTTKKTVDAKGTEEEEQYEYSDDDVNKAYSMLVEEGVLELDEGEELDLSPAGLADGVAATVRNKLKAEIAAIPPVVQQFYAHIKGGGSDKDFKADTSIKWKDADDEDEEIQKDAVRQFFANQAMDEDDIEAEITELEASGKLSAKADIALRSLKKLEESSEVAEVAARAKAKVDAEKARQAEVDAIATSIDSMDKIAGFTPTAEKKQEFKDYLFKINKRTGKTQMQENMGNEARRMNIAFLDFVDYTKADLVREVQTDLTKTRKKVLSRYSDKNVKNKNGSSVTTKTTNKTGRIKFPTIFGQSEVEIED